MQVPVACFSLLALLVRRVAALRSLLVDLGCQVVLNMSHVSNFVLHHYEEKNNRRVEGC